MCLCVCVCVCESESLSVCLHTSVSLCALGFRLAVPSAILTAVDEAHLHSEPRRLLPSLARRAPAHTAAVPVAFGSSCAVEPVSDIQPTATSSGPGVSVGGNFGRSFPFCGATRFTEPHFTKSWSSLLFLSASLSCTRWKPDDSLAGFWHLWLLNYREAPSHSLNSMMVWLPRSLVALFILSSKEAPS